MNGLFTVLFDFGMLAVLMCVVFFTLNTILMLIGVGIAWMYRKFKS